MPGYGNTQIVLSDKAFTGIVLSSIEVYKKECLGILLVLNRLGE